VNATPDTPVTRLLTDAVLTVDMNQAAVEVKAAMNRRGVRFAAVSQGGRITAVLDRLSLNRRLAGSGIRLRVSDVVHPGMACLRSTATAAAAARLMRVTGSAAVPVVDENHHLIGLVTADALPGVPSAADRRPDGSGHTVRRSRK